MGTNYYALNTCMVFFYNFQKLKLHASPNNNIVWCTTRDSSQQDLYIMDVQITHYIPSIFIFKMCLKENAIRQSFDSHRTVIRQSSDSHQAVIRQSSGSHQTVIRQSPDSHQTVIRQSLNSHQTVIRHLFIDLPWIYFETQMTLLPPLPAGP